ncbi:hypothetical protein IRJ41_020026, partial [Triplophysa rosa]
DSKLIVSAALRRSPQKIRRLSKRVLRNREDYGIASGRSTVSECSDLRGMR